MKIIPLIAILAASAAVPEHPAPTEEDLVTFTRETYDGPLVVGEDGMTFDITHQGVERANGI
jgi:hypothetical protein